MTTASAALCSENRQLEQGKWRNQAISLIDLARGGFECNGDITTAVVEVFMKFKLLAAIRSLKPLLKPR